MRFSNATNGDGPTDAGSNVAYGWLALGIVVEALLVLFYFQFTPAEPTQLRYVLYPFVWINVGLWAVARIRPPTATRRERAIATVVAIGYFAALALVAGLVGFGSTHGPPGIRLTMASPGWGPHVAYVTETFHLQFIPYRVLGYLSLSYLAYVTVLDATTAAVAGVVGFGSCLGCSLPVLEPTVAGVVGGSATLFPAVASLSIDVSTAVFVGAVALLYWRPGIDSLVRRRRSDDR